MAGYVGNVPIPQSVREDQSFTATAGQTTFNTLGYTDGNRIKVTLNGVLLEGGGVDYTATNGSDVVLTVAAVIDDIVRFETFNEFNLVGQNLTTPTFKTSLTMKNDTEEDTDGGRESTVIFSGEQSGGEITTLAEIEASHDGTADDQKGDLIFRTNDGNDGTSPTERLRINSGGDMLFSSEDPSLTLANTTHEDSEGGRESTIAFQGEQSGGEISLLAQIEAAHDGTADDQKGDLIFRTNDGSDGTSPTEALRIQSDQKIGVGVNDPDATLDISGGSNKLGILRVTQRASGAAAYGLDVGLDSTLGDPVFSRIVNDTVTESFRVNRANGALISSGGITLGTTSGAYAAANTLDDYEVGTFTPLLYGGTTAGTVSVGTHHGHYIKVGNFVHVEVRVENVTLSGAGGQLSISGLPFATRTTYSYSVATPMMYNFAFTSNNKTHIYTSPNDTVLRGLESQPSTGWTLWSITNSNGLYMNFSLSYGIS